TLEQHEPTGADRHAVLRRPTAAEQGLVARDRTDRSVAPAPPDGAEEIGPGAHRERPTLPGGIVDPVHAEPHGRAQGEARVVGERSDGSTELGVSPRGRWRAVGIVASVGGDCLEALAVTRSPGLLDDGHALREHDLEDLLSEGM